MNVLAIKLPRQTTALLPQRLGERKAGATTREAFGVRGACSRFRTADTHPSIRKRRQARDALQTLREARTSHKNPRLLRAEHAKTPIKRHNLGQKRFFLRI